MNSSSSFSPTAKYSFKRFIHLKTTVPFFLTKLRCPLPFWRVSPAIRVSQPIVAEKENDRWCMFMFQRGEWGIKTWKRRTQLCGDNEIK